MTMFRSIFAAPEARSVIRVAPITNHSLPRRRGSDWRFSQCRLPWLRARASPSARVGDGKCLAVAPKGERSQKGDQGGRRFLENEFSKSKAWFAGQT